MSGSRCADLGTNVAKVLTGGGNFVNRGEAPESLFALVVVKEHVAQVVEQLHSVHTSASRKRLQVMVDAVNELLHKPRSA